MNKWKIIAPIAGPQFCREGMYLCVNIAIRKFASVVQIIMNVKREFNRRIGGVNNE